MGNHEYCEDCGENTFHNDRPCNPDKIDQRKQKQRIAEQKDRAARQRAKSFAIEIKSLLGVPCEFDDYGNIFISKWSIK